MCKLLRFLNASCIFVWTTPPHLLVYTRHNPPSLIDWSGSSYVAVWTHTDPSLRTLGARSATRHGRRGRAAHMARLATLISGSEFFIPLVERIMTDPKDKEKPGLFLKLFPHPISRLFLVLLWKINSEQDGDAAILSNVWLRGFANLDAKSLVKYRGVLNDRSVIRNTPLGNGRNHIYRLVKGDGRPFEEETDTDAEKRLRNPDRIREVVRSRSIKRWGRSIAEIPKAEPLEPTSSWDTDGEWMP